MATPFTGWGGHIKIGTVSPVTIPVENWSLSVNNELQDVTTTSSNGWIERIAGAGSAQLTATIIPLDTTIASIMTTLAQGTTIATTLYVGPVIGSVQFQWAGNFVVGTLGTENNPKTPIKLSLTADNTGPVAFSGVSA